jgi:hypothetical protein
VLQLLASPLFSGGVCREEWARVAVAEIFCTTAAFSLEDDSSDDGLQQGADLVRELSFTLDALQPVFDGLPAEHGARVTRRSGSASGSRSS